jgi:oligopeptide transport system substrate-binding protein
MGLTGHVVTSTQRADAAAEQVLRLVCTEPQHLDMGLIGGGPEIQWVNFMFEGLTRYDWEQKTVVPAAAQSWDVSADNLTYTFHLNEGMLWSDGSPLTAHDFEYAIKRNLDPTLAGPVTTFLFPLKGAEDYFTGKTTDVNTVAVTAKDDVTLEMTLNAPTPYWLVILSLWLAMPIAKKSIDAGGEKWIEPEYIVSNGRFKMDSWAHTQSMVLVQNDQFHGEKPGITRIEYTIFEDANAQGLTAFETGDVDLAPVSVANADFVANDPTLSELRYQAPVSGTWQLRIDMSNANSVLKDVNVRKALYLAIDRDVLTQKVLKGFSTPAYVLTSPDIASYDPNARLQGTVEDAKKYLADAGFPDGKDFPGFQLGYNGPQENAQLVSEALLQMWKDNLGITNASVFAVPTDWRTRIKTESYDMYLGQWITDFPDPYEWHNVIFEGDAWQTKWTDQTYLDMIKAANVEPDPDKRNQQFAAAEAYRIQDQMATIPLFTVGRLWVIQPWVQGLTISPLDGPILGIQSVTIADH